MYRAHDRRLGRDVAVRVTDVSALDDDDIARLTRGAQAAAQVTHPNVARVQDFGRDGDAAFVVTELLPGRSLADELQAGALPPERAAQLNNEVAHGLAAAHERGVVHGDLTDEKVLVAGDGRYVLAGFGRAVEGATPAEDLAALEALVTRARGGAAAMAADATVTLPVADATSVLPIAGATAAAAATSPFAGWRIRRTTAALLAAIVMVLGLALIASARSGGSLTPPTTTSPPTTVTVAPVTTAATTPTTTAPAPAKPQGHGKHHEGD